MTSSDSPLDPKTLLVGISNPATASRLVRVAAILGGSASWKILLAHVVQVAEQISLTTGQSSPEVVRARDLLRDQMKEAEAQGVRVGALVEVARSVADGLLSATESHGAAMILVGYSEWEEEEEEGGGEEERFDRTMHRVARKSPVDVVVAKFRQEEMRRVLVPVADAPPTEVVRLLCRALAQASAAHLTFLHVAAPDSDLDEEARRISEHLSHAGLLDSGSLEVLTAQEPAEAILLESEAYDLVVLGPSKRPGIMNGLFSTRTRTIAENTVASVLLAWNRTDNKDH